MPTYYVDAALGNDANAGTSPGPGNAWASITKAGATAVAGDAVHVRQSGTYAYSAPVALANGGNKSAGPVQYEGYAATPGDRAGRPAVVMTGSGNALFNPQSAMNNVRFVHFAFSHAGSSRGPWWNGSTYGYGPEGLIEDCTFDGFQTLISGSAVAGRILSSTLANFTGSPAVLYRGGLANVVYNCRFSNNAGVAIASTNGSGFALGVCRCRFSGGTRHLDLLESYGASLNLDANAFFNASSDAVRIAAKNSPTEAADFTLTNNAFWSVGGYAINDLRSAAASRAATLANANNAYGAITSGKYTAAFPAGRNEVNLTANPFADAAAGDFSPNSAPGGGALLRAAGFPNFADIGAIQHQDAGGGGTTIVGYKSGQRRRGR